MKFWLGGGRLQLLKKESIFIIVQLEERSESNIGWIPLRKSYFTFWEDTLYTVQSSQEGKLQRYIQKPPHPHKFRWPVGPSEAIQDSRESAHWEVLSIVPMHNPWTILACGTAIAYPNLCWSILAASRPVQTSISSLRQLQESPR